MRRALVRACELSLLFRRLVRSVQNGETDGERDECEHEEQRAQAARAARFTDARVCECGLDIGERARVTRAPELVLGEGFAAPEQAARATALLPLACGGAELIAKACAFGVFASPADEAGPCAEQLFVDDFDALFATLAFGCDEKARGDEAFDHGVCALTTAEELDELFAREDRARAFGGDEVAECFAYEALLLGGERGESLFGVLREGANDA